MLAAVATVRRLEHEKFTSRETGELLSEAKERVKGLDRDSDLHRLVTVAARDYDKATRVPAAFVSEQAQTVSAAHHAWVEARSKSDFSIFRPHLQKVVDLKRRVARIYRDDGSESLVTADGGLNGENVLPEFSCSLASIL